MCHFGPFRDIFGGNSFSEISDDFYALKLLFLPFFDQTIRNSQKMSIAVFQLFERNHYVPKALWYMVYYISYMYLETGIQEFVCAYKSV